MIIYPAVFLGMLGLAIGSFLNVCIDWLPSRKSLLRPGSRCDSCHQPLRWHDNIPLLSYLLLRGKCRYCQARIPLRVPLIELSTATLFVLLFFKYGLTPDYLFIVVYSCIFLVLAVIDLENGLLLNIIVYPTMLLAIIISIFYPDLLLNDYPPRTGILNSLLGGGIGFAILFIPALITRTGMGWGDVKMAGMLGLITGYPNVFVAILGGIILGGITGALLLLTRRKKRKETIPFGPFLSIAGIVTLLWGKEIITWYLGLYIFSF